MNLLEPGSYRARGVADGHTLVSAMLRVEVAWLRTLADRGAATADQVDAVVRAVEGWLPDLDEVEVEDAGNPVLPLVWALRTRVGAADPAVLVHVGLTSQDVLDTALMLLAKEAMGRVVADLDRVAPALARLAEVHRSSVMVGRTLTQYAVPTTFGLRAAQWLTGVLDARDRVDVVRRTLPAQCGGAAGTLSLAAGLVRDPTEAASALALRLELAWPGLPWHSRRTPVTRVGDALVEVLDALGVIAVDVLTLGRPEIGEVSEAPATGRGASSTMPHKQNPVLATLVNAASLQAPQLSAQLHLCSAQAVDDRPPGAWHAEWSAFRRLLRLSVVATAQAAELVAGLRVDTAVMALRVEAAADLLLAEQGGSLPGGALSYLGAADAFVDAALERFRGVRGDT